MAGCQPEPLFLAKYFDTSVNNLAFQSWHEFRTLQVKEEKQSPEFLFMFIV